MGRTGRLLRFLKLFPNLTEDGRSLWNNERSVVLSICIQALCGVKSYASIFYIYR